MSDVRQWLEHLGLGEYADTFAENAIEWELLAALDHEVLKDIGIAAAGHRMRILKAARTLGDAPEPAVADVAPDTTSVKERTAVSGEAERRQLTVMFCDLVGSTELSQRTDPEELSEVMRAFQDRCAGAISRFGGFIARYMGDGLLVYFGYPQAWEDAPERSVRAGLEVVAGMRELNRELGTADDARLEVRVGIATGMVVVGDIVGEGAAAESAVVGETPNLAARLQGEAGPDEILIADSTRALIGEHFVLDDLGGRTLKGIAGPARVWRVRSEQTTASARDRRRASAQSKIVGRQEEVGLLLRAWDACKAGHGQVVLITGDAGIGKSRLLEALRERISGEGYVWNAIRCSPYHSQSALYPVVRQLESVLRWNPENSAQEKLEKLERAVTGFSFEPADVVPLLASLLSLPLPETHYPPLALIPQQQRQLTLDAIVGWLFEEAERKPVLQVWEDVHWADPSSLELLDLFVEQTPTAAVLNIVTFRPEFEPPWPRRSHVIPITLNRLERPEIEAMIDGLARNKIVPPEVVAHIVDKSDGVPLYIEELTKSILESPLLTEGAERFELNGTLDDVTIPATLQDSLMSRLDRVPTVRDLVQIGAVIGREFAYEMLDAIAGVDEKTLRAGLNELVSAELLYQRGRPPRARYVFKHALIQDAAYQSLLKRSRERFHREVAELLVSRFPELATAQPEFVAHHYAEAGCPDQAVEHWTMAGQLAMRRWAAGEAAGHLREALHLLDALPASHERDRRELDIQMALGPALLASRGFAEPMLEPTYRRATELAAIYGDHARACLALRGRQIFHFARGELQKARHIGEELRARAYTEADTGFRVGGHHAVGQCLFMLGDFAHALETLEAGANISGANEVQIADWPGGQPTEQCHIYAGFASWALGYPERTALHAQKAHAISSSFSNSISLINTEAFVAAIYFVLRDLERARQHAERAVAMSQEFHNPSFLHYGNVIIGALDVSQGVIEVGVEKMEQGYAAFRAMHFATWTPLFGCLLASGYGLCGRAHEGIDLLERECMQVATSGEHAWDAEIRRVQGELLLKDSGDTGAAAAYLEQSLRIARKQNAKGLELRAATNIAQLRLAEGSSDEAREVLAPIYETFNEGLSTPDLADAASTLEACGAT